MKSPLLHIAGMIYDQVLAIVPEKLDAILRAVGPRLTFDQSALQQLIESRSLSSNPALAAEIFAFDEDDPDDTTDEKPYKLTQAGIAVIPIRGALMKRGGWMAALSGCSSYETLGKTFDAAMSDPLARAIMFDVDSPGGSTNGCFELADHIFDSRGVKPIWGCANDMAGSAAYALISSCDRVFLTRTAAVGSIGVFALHCDQSKMDEKLGASYTYIFAGDKKVDGNPHEPLTRSDKRDMQGEVDRQYEIFVTTVARNRDVGADKVRSTEAGVSFGPSALPLLADQVATFDDAMSFLAKKIGTTSASKTTSSQESVASHPSMSDNVADGIARQSTQSDSTNPVSEHEGASSMKTKLQLLKEAQAAVDAEALELAAKKPVKAKDKEPDDDVDDDEKDLKKKKEEEEEEEACDTKEADAEADDAKKPEKKKATITTIPLAASNSQSDAREIAALCTIAGMEDLTNKYITKGYSVEQVRSFLQARRAKLSAENQTSSSFSGTASQSGGGLVEQAFQQVDAMVAASGGTLSRSKAMEQILLRNPAIYDEYDEARDHLARSGSRREQQAYVAQNQQRYMRALGLSSVIDDVPTARKM